MTTTSFLATLYVREHKKNTKFPHNKIALNVKSQFPPHVTILLTAATIFCEVLLP